MHGMEKFKIRESRAQILSVFHITLSLSFFLVYGLYWPPQFCCLTRRIWSLAVHRIVSLPHYCIQTSGTITMIPVELHSVWKSKSKQVANGRTKPLTTDGNRSTSTIQCEWFIKNLGLTLAPSGFNVTKYRTLQLQYSCGFLRNVEKKASATNTVY